MLRPAVLHPVSLPDFVRRLVDHHATPTNLIVCSSRDHFEKHLLYCLEASRGTEPLAPGAFQDGGLGMEEDQDQDQASPAPPTDADDFLVPTLHNLFTTSTVRLTFCANLESLRAHLSSLTVKSPDPPALSSSAESTSFGRTDAYPILALLSPIALHKETTSFSAQGLSRTLAIAVDAAAFRKRKLIIAECPAPHHLLQRPNDAWMEDEELVGAGLISDTEGEGDEETKMEDARGGPVVDEPGDVTMGGPAVDEDPWAEKLSILNVTTKSFGIGDRGWAGRTVTARSVAERWCRFEMPQPSSRDKREERP